MPDDKLRGPRLRIERAYSHLNDIEVAVKTYLGNQPYHLFIDLNADKSKHLVKLERVIELPEIVALMVSDCIHNFRSALDLLAICMSERNGGTTTAGIEFPIKRNKETFEEAIEKAEIKKAFGPEGIALLKKIGPYNTPDAGVLWILHHMDRRNKHIGLNTVGGIPVNTQVVGRMVAGTTEPLTFSAPKALQPLGKEAIILEAPNTGTDFYVDADITLSVSFGDIEGLKNASVVDTLKLMGSVVTNTFARFEREFFKP